MAWFANIFPFLARARAGRLLTAWSLCVISGAEAMAAKPYQAPLTHRIEQTINRKWVFDYLPNKDADAAGCQDPAFDDLQWSAIAVPHTWQTYETTGKIHPFIHDASEKEDSYWWDGWGWYRKHFSINEGLKGRKVFVEFDGVQKYCKIWLNGHLIGDHKGGYSGFDFDLTDFIKWDGDNVMAVAVNNQQNDPLQIPPMSAGNFDVYGGIYRDVRIVIKDRLYIPFQGSSLHEGGTFITTPQVSEAAGTVRIRTWVRNDQAVPRECELRTTLSDPQGRVLQVLTARKTLPPGELAQFDQSSEPVDHPRLWSPDDPSLYHVFSDLFDGGTAVDHFESPLGFREFEWDYKQNRLILNGRKVIIHGSNHHQEYPWLGDATPKWLQLLDMKDFRENLNNNFIRTAHYPQDPAIYDYCDRSGIIVIEEVPNIKRQRFSPEIQEQQLREMIRRDRNHPSIFFWSMGNETDDAVDSKFAVAEDPTRILFGRDIYNDSGGQYIRLTQDQLELESLLRCTIRGWYNRDVRDLEPKNGQKTGNEEWQHDQAADEIIHLNQGRTRDDLANLNTWIYEDHGADRIYQDCPLKYVNPKGWVDCWRTPKYMYYLWQAIYAEKPMVFIHPHFWRSSYIGRKETIVVDSNCDTVELKVNGRSVGLLTPRLEEANVIRFENVPIEPGTLTAEGKKDGHAVLARLVMADKPARLTLSALPEKMEAGMDSVALVRADIVDAHGNHVLGATNQLDWTVSGPAKLVGPPTYVSDTAKNEAPDGTMYIAAPAFNIVRSLGSPGEIKVRVQSPGLAPAEIAITVTVSTSESSSAIVEPPRRKGDRQPVSREKATSRPAENYAVEMKAVAEDIQIQGASLEEYTERIDRFIQAMNPRLDFTAPEYRAVVFAFAELLQKNQGHLVRDDFNFMAGFYNDCRCITSRVEGMKRPLVFRRSLREYYARTIIEGGKTLDCNGEIAWLASLPAGQIVVAGTPSAPVAEPGVIYTERTSLEAIVTLICPEFAQVSPEEKPAILKAVCALNPQIGPAAVPAGDQGANDESGRLASLSDCKIPEGVAVLVPSLKVLEGLGQN